MTVAELAQQLHLRPLTEGDMSRAVSDGYAGDLLSWVMGRAASGAAWITVMGHLNAIAVAVLTDVSCIVLADNAPLDEDARIRANTEGVAVLQSDRPAYVLCAALSELLAGQ